MRSLFSGKCARIRQYISVICSVKRGLNVSAKSFVPCQSAQADMGRNLLLFCEFCIHHRTGLSHNSLGFLTKSIFKDSESCDNLHVILRHGTALSPLLPEHGWFCKLPDCLSIRDYS